MDSLIFILGLGGRIRAEVLATRGDRLVLSLVHFSNHDVEVDILLVAQVDDDAQYVHATWLDPDAIDAGYAELEARYATTLHGELRARSVARAAALTAYDRDDLEPVLALCSPTMLVHDHRGVGFGMIDRDGRRAHMERLKADAPGARFRVHHLIESAEAVLRVNTISGTATSGDFELVTTQVLSLGPDGRWERIDIYGPDQLDEAVARYEEPIGTSGSAPLRVVAERTEQPFTNAAVRNVQRLVELWPSKDLHRIGGPFAEGNVYDDRRRAAMMQGITVEDSLRLVLELDDSAWSRPVVIATRGDRLALWSSTFSFADGDAGPADAELLVVGEVDESGLRTATVTFDPDDLEAAYDELDARYVAQGGHDVGAVGRAYRDGDWDSLATQFTSDFESVDHRVLGLIGGGVDELIRDNQNVLRMSPDGRLEVSHVIVASPLAVHSLCRAIGTIDGGEYEIPLVFVGGITADEQWWIWEFFDEDQLDEARARYEELADPAAVHPDRAI